MTRRKPTAPITKDIPIELEERICANGCGKKFKVMSSSKQTTARGDCLHSCKGERKWTPETKNYINSFLFAKL